MKKHTVQLKESEIIHILNLIENNKEDQIYYAPAYQYWARSKAIEEKLKTARYSNK